jgi:hypothetical protein
MHWEAQRRMERPVLAPDVAIKSFPDLDTAYFEGKLRMKCSLQWFEAIAEASTKKISSKDAKKALDGQTWGLKIILIFRQRISY